MPTNSPFNWYIDIEEDMGGSFNLFTAGPVVLQDDQQYTVSEFINKINTAFSEAYAAGRSSSLYSLTARILPMSPVIGDGYYAQTSMAWPLAEQTRQFLIQYQVSNLDSRSFKILLATGPNGQASIDTVGLNNAGNAILGTRSGDPPRGEVTAVTQANLQPLTLPYCTVSAMVTDKPPVPPDISFIPYRGRNDQLLILFSPSTGRREAAPIMLATSDTSFVIQEFYSQKGLTLTPEELSGLTETLEYASDDPARTYELFRLESKPTSYADFVGTKIATVEEQLSPQKFSTGASYLDRIRPNIKYYYCGRTIDRHQNISNPTIIFEIELVDNSGQLFLNAKLFTFETQPQKTQLSAKRLLAIEPAQLQQVYDPVAGTAPEGQLNVAPANNSIGASADAIWDQKFKIRLHSKKTGKKMDLNITFKNSGVTNP
jgi:hypothetical protein